MQKPTILRLWPFLCAAIIFSACQKETQSIVIKEPTNENLRVAGALPNDPELLAKIHLIMSSDFQKQSGNLNQRGNSKKDTDGDGIPDVSDKCISQKETFNGYQDADGCPDVAPAPTSVDTDGDGILDVNDGCISQKETFNGYQDTDGCPDTAPTVITSTSLPASYQLVMPPVQNQGSEFSCVAFAVGYAARSAEQYYKANASSYSASSNIYSPEFLYNQTKIGDCGSGTSIVRTLEFLKATGICSWQSMPYSTTNGCSLMPTSAQLSEAANYKITNYSGVYKSDVTAIKTMLVNKHPLMITVTLDQSFTNAQPGFIWKSYSGSNGFSHALTICGYDDAKQAFKVMSSWGTTWGDAGFSWIDYQFLKQTGDLWTFVINL